MKEIKAFRTPFITKKQLISRQALHRTFLKPQYKAYRGAAILYFYASFSDVTSFSKIVLNSVVYHPGPSRLASTFIKHYHLLDI